jgi:Beta-lactamase enzyme family
LSRRPFPVGMALVALLSMLLLAPASASGGAKRATGRPWKPSVAGARRYARTRLGDVSFAIVGRHARPRSFRGARTAPAASVIKAMLLLAYLRQGSVRNRRLRADEVALLEPMIRASDNAAGIQVAGLLGEGRVEGLARAARMRDFQWVYEPGWLGGLSQISARDQARFMRRFERFAPDRHRRFARRLLRSVVSWQRWGVADVRHRGWRLYFKGGWGIADDGVGTVSHQVGFLERGHCRLGLAILTEHNPSTAYGIETLRGVAARLLHGLHTTRCGSRARPVRRRLRRRLDLRKERRHALDLLTAGARAELGQGARLLAQRAE